MNFKEIMEEIVGKTIEETSYKHTIIDNYFRIKFSDGKTLRIHFEDSEGSVELK